MRYYKTIDSGYLVLIGTGFGGEEITAEEYHNITKVISDVPTAPDGHAYRLKADLTWELYELPVVFILPTQSVAIPRSLALFNAGRSIPAKIAMIAITTSNSINVKQDFLQVHLFDFSI